MYSLFEEQIIHESLELDHYLSRRNRTYPEALSYLPDGGLYAVRPEKYLDQVAGLKKTLHIPVIGSLNGVSKGGWTNYARKIEEAGADALELNLYYISTDPDMTSTDIEDMQVEIGGRSQVCHHHPTGREDQPICDIHSKFCKTTCRTLARMGLVLFNRFYQPDFDLEELEIVHSLDLSTSADLRLPLRWISIIAEKSMQILH